MNNKARRPHTIRSAFACAALGLLGFCIDAMAEPFEEPFYRQFIRFGDHSGYQPTRTFTIVIDSEQSSRLVAADDPDLDFNMVWMDQFQPGYKSRNGGAAIGVLLRGYARSLFESYRSNNQGNGLTSGADDTDIHFGSDVEYDLRLKSDEVLVGVKYTF